jgi:hypothetical protein
MRAPEKAEHTDQSAIPAQAHHPFQPQPTFDRQGSGQPHNPTDHLHAQLVGLNLPQLHAPGFNDLLVYPPAVHPGLSFPACHRSLIETEGRDDRL